MPVIKMKLLAFCLVFLTTLSFAVDDKAKLSKVLNQISAVKTDLVKKEKKRLSITQQLKQLKKKIVSLEDRLKKTIKNLQAQKRVLQKLINKQKGYQLDLQEAENKLSSQIKSAYQTGSMNHFKVMLGKEKKESSDLILSYHKYIFMDRIKKMRNISVTVERLEKNKKKIEKEARWLERIEKKQARQKRELAKTKKERDKALRLLKGRIAGQNKKLKKLLQDKKNLEKLVNRLTRRKVATGLPVTKTKLCKNFIWPTKGKTVIHFGSPIENSSWKYNGIIIRATKNQPVYAVSSGKVVYADYLSGYGLLLIIDHGDGYMSLYGHNGDLRQELHSQVNGGDIIAAVGQRDVNKHELYFAMRYNGKPIDPEKWCQR